MKTIRKIAPFIVIGVLIYYLGTRVHWPETISILSSISPLYVVGSVALSIIGAVSMATLQFALTTDTYDRKINLRVDAINAKVLGYSTILPTAIVAAYKIAAFKKVFESSSKAIAFFAVGKICTLFVALCTLILIGYRSANFFEFADKSLGSAAFFASIAAMICAAILVTNLRWVRQRLMAIAEKVFSRRISDSLRSIKSLVSIKAWFVGIFTQALAFLLTAAVSGLLATAINPNFPIEAVVLARAVTLIALLAPISVAGIGAREISYLAILPLYSVDVNTTASLLILLLLTQWLAGLFSVAYSLLISRFEQYN